MMGRKEAGRPEFSLGSRGEDFRVGFAEDRDVQVHGNVCEAEIAVRWKIGCVSNENAGGLARVLRGGDDGPQALQVVSRGGVGPVFKVKLQIRGADKQYINAIRARDFSGALHGFDGLDLGHDQRHGHHVARRIQPVVVDADAA